MFGHCYDRPWHGHIPPGARAKWGWDANFMSGFFGAEGRGRGRWRSGRMFEQGDLRYVVLRLLEEKPRHGYEIIKDLESRFGGSYAPSPGTVYPTLTMLEDLGYAKVVPEDGGKKIYEITDEGRRYLKENSSTVDDIFSRIAEFVEGFTDAPMRELNQSFQRLARATYKTATGHIKDKQTIESIRDIIRRAADEVEAITAK